MKQILALNIFLLIIFSNHKVFADFPIRQSSNWDGFSAVAYNSKDNEYLVVWTELIYFGGPIMAQRVSESGSLLGNAFTITDYAVLPSIAYNTQTNEYLIVYLSTNGVYGQKVSAAGTLTGSSVQLIAKQATPRIIYNSLAGNYLLACADDAGIYTQKISAAGQPFGASQQVEVSPGGPNESNWAIAYAPISTIETPDGRYLLVIAGSQPIMLDSDGAVIYVVSDLYHPGLKYKGIPFSYYISPWGNIGGVYFVDVAYGYMDGNGTFLIVYGDNNNIYDNGHGVEPWTGIWGNTVNPYKLDYTTDDLIPYTAFPISAIYKHWIYGTDDYAGSWKPRVVYNYPGQKFMVTWRETPGDEQLNDTKVNHIRADKVWKPITYDPNVVISSTSGNEDPRNPAIAASTKNPDALIVWEDHRNFDSNKWDLYGNLYSISSAPSITVVQPNGGENWNSGSSYEIKWSCKSFSDPVMIEYSTDGGTTWTSITNSTSNDGSYMWTVPNQASDYCLIRIKDASDGDPSDISDAVFTISVPVPKITLIQPNGGEKWAVGTQYEIKWSSENFTDPVSLQYSTDGGATWTSVSNSTANDGSYMWTIPDYSSENCYMKIKDASDGDPFDVNDAAFTIFSSKKIVGNTNDSGLGSFRQAIIDANADPGFDTIVFHIPGLGPHTIKPLSELPEITDPVVIDGYTQPGSSPNTNPISSGSNAILMIQLEGPMNPTFQNAFGGLLITAGHSIVRGLVINNFNYWYASGSIDGICIMGKNNNRIEGNFLGTNVSGTAKISNSCAIYINSDSNIIGGITPDKCNLISGNDFGVWIGDQTSENKKNNKIEGNLIGTRLDGKNPLGNIYGIVIQGVFNNVIGGNTSNTFNTIAFNNKDGILIRPSFLPNGQNGSGNSILGNSIFNNDGLGINVTRLSPDGVTPNDKGDGDLGPNNFQNYPVITSIDNNDITGISGYLNSTPNTTFRINFYSNSKADPSGYGEGENYINWTEVTTDNDGLITFNSTLGLKVPDNYYITATATDPEGSTSEFSNNIPIKPNTPEGLKVQSAIGSGINVTFENITDAGYTTSETYTGGPPVPNGSIPFPFGSPVYYSINTTANHSGNIEVGIRYNDSGFAAGQESKLRLNVYESSGWKDITSFLNLDSNIIYGITSHLSDFVITIPSSSPLYILVTNTQDTGIGSLRNALELASINSGPDTILFQIPTSDSGYNPISYVWTIKPALTLTLPEGTTIDGRIFTAPDSSRPGIEIDGTILQQGGMDGIWMNDETSIRGLIVNRCQYGVWIAGSNVTVEACYIGTDAAGNSTKSNGLDGILITNGSKNVIIQNNLISGNENNGIRAFGEETYGDTIRNNSIGTNSDGTVSLSNERDGIQLHAGAHNFFIENNLVSGNKECGIHLLDSATDCNIIKNNRIGINTLGDSLPNGTFGVALFNGPKKNIIGPDNFIAYNTNCGILIDGSDIPGSTVGNTITANKITCNGSKGIHNYRGGNTEIAPPIINSITDYLVSGTALPGETVELFIDESDEGFFFISADTADAYGNFSYLLPIQLPSLSNIAATATDTAGNTSEFSLPYKLTSVKENLTKIIPKEFKLLQNYPNPFNPNTNIIYHLAAQSRVTLKIYDILGNEIATLINEEKSAGVYQVNLNARAINNKELSSGVYFYQLRAVQSGGPNKVFISTKKFVLLK